MGDHSNRSQLTAYAPHSPERCAETILPVLGHTIPFALMMLMGGFVYGIGRHASRGDEAFLREFLAKTIGAQSEPLQNGR